jgi:RHS repeat-associated protein
VVQSYDTHGRVAAVTNTDDTSSRTTTFEYSSSTGYLESTTDAAGQNSYQHDALGRVVEWTRPDGAVVRTDYDPNGNVVSITPPDRLAHDMSYTALDMLSEYAPPPNADGGAARSTVYEYTPDHQLQRVRLPDSRFIEYGYRTDGKLATVSTPLGTSTYTYNPVTGGLREIQDATGGTLSFGSDGQLPTMVVWGGQGHVRGWVSWTYDPNFRAASLGVNGATIASFGRDADGLITSAGAMQLVRAAQTGDVAGTTLGEVSTVEQTSARGEFERYQATYRTGALYSEEVLSRDGVGRITLRREIVQGAATEYGYEYDGAGRLSSVRVDGVLARRYVYDANGNRLSRNTGTAAQSCSYDGQDRLVGCGDIQYTYNAVGQLSGTTDRVTAETAGYDYDVMGNLRSVALPSGRLVEYEIDARNRRVGKRVDGVRQWGLLYQSQLAPVAQVDAHNAVVSTFVYGTRSHAPDYMVKRGQVYRFVSDHLGSVRLVVNVATGVVAQRMDYDEFGNVLADTNSGFQPFGFAGGLYDADTGLVRFGARDYDAVTGRWTAKDPILFTGGDTNLYAYVGNDPINYVDPNGLSKFDELFDLPKKFWNWYHRKMKEKGAEDLTEEEARQLHKEWEDMGKPGPDQKRKRGKDDWGDLFDLFIPFPDLPDPCWISPEVCGQCPDKWKT